MEATIMLLYLIATTLPALQKLSLQSLGSNLMLSMEDEQYYASTTLQAAREDGSLTITMLVD